MCCASLVQVQHGGHGGPAPRRAPGGAQTGPHHPHHRSKGPCHCVSSNKKSIEIRNVELLFRRGTRPPRKTRPLWKTRPYCKTRPPSKTRPSCRTRLTRRTRPIRIDFGQLGWGTSFRPITDRSFCVFCVCVCVCVCVLQVQVTQHSSEGQSAAEDSNITIRIGGDSSNQCVFTEFKSLPSFT